MPKRVVGADRWLLQVTQEAKNRQQLKMQKTTKTNKYS